MNSARKTLIGLATLWFWVAAQSAWAAPEKVEKDAFIAGIAKDGFTNWSVKMDSKVGDVKIELTDNGKAVQLSGPAITNLAGKPNDSRVQLETVDGRSALHIQGPVGAISSNEFMGDTMLRRSVVAYLPVVQSNIFVLEVDIMGAGGIEFGGGYRVAITTAGNVGVLNYQDLAKGETRRIGTKYMSLFKWNRLKVVCTPAFIRVYSRDTLKEDILPVSPTNSRIALFAGDAYFSNLRIIAQPLPLEGATIMPAPPKIVPEAYAFPTGADVTVNFDVLNYSASNLVYSLTIDKFYEASKKEIGQRTIPPAQLTPLRLTFELGRLEIGLYNMHLACSFEGKPGITVDWPLAILRSMGGAKETYVRPPVSVAIYLKAMNYMRSQPPFYGNTYIYKLLDDLRWYGINSMVEYGRSLSEENLDLCQRYGISIWDRGTPRNHRVVLGGLLGDEPTGDDLPEYVKMYAEARAAQKDPDQLLLTNIIEDRVYSGISNFFWDVIKPRHRLMRIYSQTGCTKTCDNLTMAGRSWVSYPGQLKAVQAYSGNTPYSAVLPTFGGVAGFYRDPTPAEVKFLMHLSLAYGAKNLFPYCYQSEFVGERALVDIESLRPQDDKLATLGQVCRTIQPHGQLIKSLEPDQRRVYCSNPWVEAVPMRSGANTYIYAVNRDVKDTADAELFWDPECKPAEVRDLYANRVLRIFQSEFKDGKASDRVKLSLLPGDGKLLAVTENK